MQRLVIRPRSSSALLSAPAVLRSISIFSSLSVLFYLSFSILCLILYTQYVRLLQTPPHRPALRLRQGQADPRPGMPTVLCCSLILNRAGRAIRRERLRPRRHRLPGPARRWREAMADHPGGPRGPESQSPQAGPVEHVPAQESLLAGRRVHQSRVRPHG